MKLYYFSEMPHHEYPDAEGDKYPSLRLAFPNTNHQANRYYRKSSSAIRAALSPQAPCTPAPGCADADAR